MDLLTNLIKEQGGIALAMKRQSLPKARNSEVEQRFRLAEEQFALGNRQRGLGELRALAIDGHVGAQHNLGYLYDTGEHVRRNLQTALYWYRRAYANGSGIAASNIGICYRDRGRISLALKWFKRAASRGDFDAAVEIAKIYLRRPGGQRFARPWLNAAVSVPATQISAENRSEARNLIRQMPKIDKER